MPVVKNDSASRSKFTFKKNIKSSSSSAQKSSTSRGSSSLSSSATSRNVSNATKTVKSTQSAGSGFAPSSRPGVITRSGNTIFKNGKLVGNYNTKEAADSAYNEFTGQSSSGKIRNIAGDNSGETYRQLYRVDQGKQTGQANTSGIKKAIQSYGFQVETGVDAQGNERILGAQTPKTVQKIQNQQRQQRMEEQKIAREQQKAYVAGQPWSRQAPVLQDKAKEDEARSRIAQERGIDLNNATASQRMLLNEAVNTDVYGMARPNFQKGADVLSAGQKTQEQILASKQQNGGTFSIPENLNTGINETIVTSKGAETFTNEQLAKFEEYNQENSDEVVSSLDSLIESDPDILAAQESGDDMQALLEQQRQFYEEQYNQLKDEIQAIYDAKEADYEEQAAIAMGAAVSQMASIGAFGVTTSGMRYIDSVNRENQAKILALASEEAAALNSAYSAFMEADFGIAEKMINTAKSTREEIRAIKADNLQRQKTLMELKQMEREDVGQTVTAIASSGMTAEDLPAGYLEYLDQKSGYPSGTTASLLDVASKEKIQADKTLAIEQATKLNTLLSSLPVGETITIAGVQYTSRNKGSENIYTEYDGKGNMNIIRYNQDTGDVVTTTVRGVSPQDGWEFKESNGVGLWINTNTREIKVAYDTTQPNQGIPNADALKVVFPDGYKPTDIELSAMGLEQIGKKDGGIQCGQLYRYITGYDGGSISSREQKQALIDSSIGTKQNPPQAGDGFIQLNAGSFGHIGTVLSSTELEDGSFQMNIVDANAFGDGIVRYRQINSKDVSGFTRHGLKPEFQFGTDSDANALRTFSGEDISAANVSEFGRNKDGKYLSDVDKIVGNMTVNPTIKNFTTQRSGYSVSQGVPDVGSNAQQQISLVYAYMKLLDPDSVVREGEFATAQKYDSFLNGIGVKLNNLFSGKIVSDTVVKNIKEEIQRMYSNSENNYSQAINQYKAQAENFKIDSSDIFAGFYVPSNDVLQNQPPVSREITPQVQSILDSYGDLSEEDIQDALNEWYMNY